MATYITAGVTTITPRLVDGYESEREGGTIVHPILGRREPDVTLRPAGLDAGKLVLLFDVEADALTARNALSAAGVFRLVSDERTIGMYFVVPEGERLSFRLNDDTRDDWVVEVPFHEVTP
ncbi:hypothetical protein [Microbacterium sp. Ag1]|uniref:hypothetical protein n=1 Tax=Microbacterium sp. Ag1 TaxID=1643443 RepID=UPI0012E04CC8|nr:hypothetical protein [Microbacterium sp. Ag1]